MPACGQMLFHRELEANLVCHACGHHMRIGQAAPGTAVRQGAYTRIELPKPVVDPLKFRDSKRYVDRLKEAQAKHGRTATRSSSPMARSACPPSSPPSNFGFMAGSMGIAVGEAIVAAADLAVLQVGAP
jgi:acetyl-CoA carboxylase carboxyl transferase subunit beta